MWPYPASRPFYWYPPGHAAGNGFSFAAGALVGSAIWGGVDWFRNRVQINPLRYNNFNRTNISNTNWTHNPAHRGAVPYRDAGVAQRFGNQSNAGARETFRGQAEAGRRDLGNQAAANKLGQKGAAGPKAGNRTAGSKAAGSKAAGNKAAGGSKATATRNAAGERNAATSKTAANQRHAGNKQARSTPAGSRQAARTSASPGRPAGARSAGGARAASARAGGRGGRGGGGRRSDLTLKHDVTLLGYLDNGIGFCASAITAAASPMWA